MEKEETNALERLDGDDGNDDDRAAEKNTNPLALAPTTLSTTTASTNTPTPTAVGETLVGQTAKSAQIDLWLQQTLSNLPVQSWNVTSLGGNAEKAFEILSMQLSKYGLFVFKNFHLITKLDHLNLNDITENNEILESLYIFIDEFLKQ